MLSLRFLEFASRAHKMVLNVLMDPPLMVRQPNCSGPPLLTLKIKGFLGLVKFVHCEWIFIEFPWMYLEMMFCSYHQHHSHWKEFHQTRVQKYLDLRHHLPKVFVAAAQKYFSPRPQSICYLWWEIKPKQLYWAVRHSWLGASSQNAK